MYKSFCLFFFISFVLSFPCSAQVKHVIVIGVDGMGSRGIRKSLTPVMDSLILSGSSTLKAKAVYPTLSSPNWASMIYGVKPEQHGIRSNEWKSKERNTSVLSIFKVVRQNDSLSGIAVFHDWKEFALLPEQGVPDVMEHVKGEDAVIHTAIEYLLQKKPLFTFIHLDHVDHAGHQYGDWSCEYQQAISKADLLIGLLTAAVNNSGMKNHTVIIITSDHGFKGKGHGGRSRREKEIPWIAVGKDVKKGYKIRRPFYTYDTAATIAFLLSCPLPDSWKGKPVKTIMK